MFLDLGHIEKCGFLHGVQYVSNITFQVFLGVVKFLPFSLFFMGNFGVKNFEVLKNGNRKKNRHLPNQKSHSDMLFMHDVFIKQ